MTDLEKIQQFEDFDKAVEEKQLEKPEVKFIVNMPFENLKIIVNQPSKQHLNNLINYHAN